MLRNSRLGIRSKFALFILPATALTAILFTALVVYISSSQQVLQNQQVARDIGKRDARLLAPALWNMDFDGQKRILDVIATEERLRCIRIEEVIYEDNVMPREIATAGECRNLEDDDIEKVETPIMHRVGKSEHLVGKAVHWIDIRRDPDDVLKEVLGFSLLSLSMYVVLVFTISIGFRRVVLRPIAAMEKTLQRYGITGVRDKVDWSSQDELGAFIRVYNDSVDRQNEVERELKAARDAAENALKDLQLAKDSLVQAEKMASLGSLVAGIAHEINTPVGSSLTVATALEERTRRFKEVLASGALRKSVLDEYVEGVGEASSILGLSLHAAGEQIQKFKQVAVDQTSTQRREFNLAVVAEEVLSTLRPRIKRTNIELAVDVDPDIAMDSYPGPLGQILSNFFTNALIHGFQESGEGRINISGHLKGADTVELTFADNGVGMSAEQKKHLYDPFYTTRLGSGGSGLGMHVVYNLVTTVLGGKISVDSAPGAGTRITVTIPRAPEGGVPTAKKGNAA
ncbi:MAG: HAMP domain-containing histidine kinase [Hahellaceae bacterium]|jgi:two-component system NtrC family sensor kinase|nr:HAMP domain-containing histidine kinase [Hahellaceae bacterium]